MSSLEERLAGEAAARLPIRAIGRGFKGFDWESEGSWKGPFSFMQAADTQFGMMDNYKCEKPTDTWDKEVKLTQKAVAAANKMRPKPRFLAVCGDLVDAMPGKPSKAGQIRDLKAVLSELHPDIAPVCVCGNHDIGDRPTASTIKDYVRDFGDDYFGFWVGGVRFLVLNSQFYHDDSLVKDLRQAQDHWLAKQLESDPTRPWTHLIGFQHIPPFVFHRDEEAVEVPGNRDLNFNFADKKLRRDFLERLKRGGMSKLFCGHYHRNAGGWDENLEVAVTTAIGCQLGSDTHGVRIVRVLQDRILHEYYPLEEIPQALTLQS